MIDAVSRLPTFSFLWPNMLWLLALALVLVLGYLWLDARRQRAGAAQPHLPPAYTHAGRKPDWRRHIGPLLVLSALIALLVAVARPQAVLSLPSRIDTVIFVMDLSGSMRAQDIKPSRFRAAQQAAHILLDAQPAGVKVGVVSIAGTAAVAQAPTRSKDDVAKSIERLQVQGGTALGNGLLVALSTLVPEASVDATLLMGDDDTPMPTRPTTGDGAAPLPGSFASGAIIVFSDGESNAGPSAMQAAQMAADYGVRIYTVGVGTTEGVVLKADGWSSRVRLDEAVLKKIADTTGAQYFRLDDAAGMKQVYRALRTTLAFGKRDQVEITALFAAAGALLAAFAGLLSLWWFGRVL